MLSCGRAKPALKSPSGFAYAASEARVAHGLRPGRSEVSPALPFAAPAAPGTAAQADWSQGWAKRGLECLTDWTGLVELRKDTEGAGQGAPRRQSQPGCRAAT